MGHIPVVHRTNEWKGYGLHKGSQDVILLFETRFLGFIEQLLYVNTIIVFCPKFYTYREQVRWP